MTAIVGIGGSPRDGSVSRAALDRVLQAAEEEGGSVERFAIGDVELPVFDPDRPSRGDAPRIREAVAAADGLVIATPMYHGSYAGPVKNAIDHLRVEDVEGTTVGLVGVAGGRYPRAAVDHLRSVVRALGGWTVPDDVVVPEADGAVTDGAFAEPGLRERMERLGQTVARRDRPGEGPRQSTTKA